MNKVWIAFQYERLVGLCFNYGVVGHEARDYRYPISTIDGDKSYGEWLRVGNRMVRHPRGRKPPSLPQRNMEETND